MSENFITEHTAMEHGTRMNPAMIQSDSLTSNAFGSLEAFSNNSSLQQLPISNMNLQKDVMDNIPASQGMFISTQQMGNLEPMSNSLGAENVDVPNWRMEQMKAYQANQAQQELSLPVKRKSSPDNFTSNEQGSQKMSASTKRTALPRSQPNSFVPSVLSVPNKINAQAGFFSSSPRSSISSRKQVQSEIGLNRSQLHPQKNRHVQPVKTQSESFGAVRSKLRESFAAALALVSQKQGNQSNTEKNDLSESGSRGQQPHLPDDSTPSSIDASQQDSGKAVDTLPRTAAEPGEDHMGSRSASESITPTVEPWKFVGQEFQPNSILPYEDASFNDNFFAKDELLLGNGLAWEMDLDGNTADMKDLLPADKLKLPTQEGACSVEKESKQSCPEPEPKPTMPSPEAVASEIEAELFKLFGGVNKKYKEKGRSLMFNLKDKNNPELRERVMAGDISPARLCSMTAEELASRELSEWRIAKAEEFDQMKVLPDTEVDLRRLVRKTHKGEFQVEAFETDVSAPVDGLIGGGSTAEDWSEVKGKEAKALSKAESAYKSSESMGKVDTMGVKHGVEDQVGQCITIPSESGDILQGLMVDDIKDLPPIVSLDEFMESLDKEPPFENLPVDSEQSTPASEKASSDAGSDLKSSEQASKVGAAQKARKGGSRGIKPSGNAKPIPSRKEYVWEGLLQLNITSMANFVGIYKSGEKTSTKDWPRFFEIKGRVRLEAFEKFIHELPNSRSRAIMVVHFSLDVGCTDKDQTNLQELVDSYAAEQRLGFAEPTPGTEIYYVPPGATTLEMLNKHLPKSYTEMLDSIDGGLIGVVVWKKAQLLPSTNSPKSSFHHKENKSKRQQHLYSPTTTNVRPPKDKNMNSNVNFGSRDVVPPPPVMSKPVSSNNISDDGGGEDDDDVPPGFGPPGPNRDEDDLPEFNFSGQSKQKIPERLPSPTPAPSVDQMRQLIQKYGKTENSTLAPGGGGIVLQPWNDDEDDDIPEWQPPQQNIAAPPQQSLLRQVGNRPPLANPLQPFQPPMVAPRVLQSAGPRQPQAGGGRGRWDGGAVNRGGQHHLGASVSVNGRFGRQWVPDGSARASRNSRGYQ